MTEIINLIKSLKLIDWIVIGVAVILIAVFAVIFFRKSTYITAVVRVGEESTSYSQWLTDSLYSNDTSGVKNWFVTFFKEGQTEKDGLGKIQAEVLKVLTYDKTPTRKSVYLTVRLRVVYNKASGSYTYKGVPVLVGSKIKLSLDRVLVEGLITEVNSMMNSRDKKKLVVETQVREENAIFSETAGVKSYVADSIKVGDVVLDGDGNELIKILEKRVSPAQKTTISSDGRTHLGKDPIKKDVFLTLEIEVFQLGGKFFFLDDIPVLVDNIIPINTKTYSIFPVVTKFISTK